MFRLLDTGRPRLLLTVFCVLLWTPGFFTLPPGDRDESRFAQASKQMLETGDFVRIQNGTEPRNRKPIGIYWLQTLFAASARAAGLARANSIWPYRVPSALGALVAVLGTFWLGEAVVGRRAAFLAGAMLAGSVILTVEAHIAKTDAALLGSAVLAMAVLTRAYLEPRAVTWQLALLFWLAAAASVLLKGPIGPMVIGLAALALVVADRDPSWLRALRPGWGVPLALATVLPWFVAIGEATGGRFFADAVGNDLGRKLTSGEEAHWGPPGLHLLLVPLLIFPSCAAVPGALAQAWRARAQPVTRLLLAWLVPAWLVFEAAPTKLPHYTLPLYPALCLLLGRWLLDPDRRPIARWAAALPVIVGVGLAAALAALPAALHQPFRLGLPAAAAALVPAALWVAPLRGPGPDRRALEHSRLLASLVTLPLLYWAALGLELPNLQPLWIAPRAVAALPPGPLGAVGYAEPSLMFLAGTGTQWFVAKDGARALASGEVRNLLVGDRDLAAVLEEAKRLGVQPRVKAEIDGFNYSRGRFVTLSLLTPQP